jgi:hypothetical protein
VRVEIAQHQGSLASIAAELAGLALGAITEAAAEVADLVPGGSRRGFPADIQLAEGMVAGTGPECAAWRSSWVGVPSPGRRARSCTADAARATSGAGVVACHRAVEAGARHRISPGKAREVENLQAQIAAVPLATRPWS